VRTAVVLAGGQSRRMGADKATLPFGTVTLLERVASICGERCDEVLVVARMGQELATPWRIIRDSGEGPLGAIAAGLRAAGGDAVFVTACDTPLLQPALIDLLFERAALQRGAMAQTNGRVVATCAVYSRSLADEVDALLRVGERRAAALADLSGVVIVGEAVLRSADPQLVSLRGCNTPEEYAAVLELAGLGGPNFEARGN
jgi:molybdenum cofactor guanylyltransferase